MQEYPTIPDDLSGDAVLSRQWHFFGPYDANVLRTAPDVDEWQDPEPQLLTTVPADIRVHGITCVGAPMVHQRGQLNLTKVLTSRRRTGEGPLRTAGYIYITVESPADQEAVSFGIGGFHFYHVWLNGTYLGEKQGDKKAWPPSILDQRLSVPLKAGSNLFVVRLFGSSGGVGNGGAAFAFGGPRELAAGDFRSILSDPFEVEPEWMAAGPRAVAGSKDPVDIASRLELLVDDYMLDDTKGPLSLRLSRAAPAEVVMHMDRPWEGATNGYYNLVDAGDGRSLLYYSSRPVTGIADRSEQQYVCVAQTTDGIHFERPNYGLVEFDGSKENNIVLAGRPGHNFAVFHDNRPGVPADQRFKGTAYHPEEKGLGAFASPDGIHWRLLVPKPIVTTGSFDSQNLAFWDEGLGCYVCYCRDNSSSIRRIMRSTSKDFIEWSEPQQLEYSDGRNDHMYTNAIQPYPAAPHIRIGFPARFVLDRTKYADAASCGISDGLFMSSRDGLYFNRWVTPMIRPVTDPEVWTDRNNYPAAGIHLTSPETLSLYWSEHYRHPTNRLRRGTLRMDGFACLGEEGKAIGEFLTRPFTFSGNNLWVNYTTSAIGSIRFSLCDAEGNSLPGLDMRDSEVLFGNEVKHAVRWASRPDLSKWAGKTVRLRARMFDAELFAFQFR